MPSVTFADQQTFAVGDGPQSVVWADFNGDSKPDMAVANYNANTVSVLLNTTPTGSSTATFATPQTFAVGGNPRSLAVGDFDSDGRPDLAIANFSGTTVSVLRNTTPTGAGSVSFADQQTFNPAGAPTSVAVGDFNNDGRPDLAINTSGDTSRVTILLNRTSPGATTIAFESFQQFFSNGVGEVVVGDFNSDSRPDLAIGSTEAAGLVWVLLNKTAAGSDTASFTTAQGFSVGGYPSKLAVADFNGDGRPDIADANIGAGVNKISILLNRTAAGASTPSFAPFQEFNAGSTPYSIVAGDFNGDGRLDLATGNRDSNNVSVLLNLTAVGASSVSFAPQQTFAVGASPYAVAVADVNGDSRPDLAVANFDNDNVSALLNTTSPWVTLDPNNQQVNSGGTATFTAAAINSSPSSLTVQWQTSTNGGATWSNLSDGTYYSGTTTTTLTVSGAPVGINGSLYRAVFSNSDQSATTSAAQLIVISQYAYAAYIHAYYEYYYAYYAYATTGNTYAYYAYINAYSAFNYAYYAYYYNAIGNQAASATCAYYAYYYGYHASYYAYYAYAYTGNIYAYYAYYYGYYGYVYSYYTAQGY